MIQFFKNVWCSLTHGKWLVPLRREGDTAIHACALCEQEWYAFRPTESRHFARQAVVDASHSGNPYQLNDYHATRDGYDPGEPDGDGGYDGGSPLGRGDTRWAAIRDLIEQEAA